MLGTKLIKFGSDGVRSFSHVEFGIGIYTAHHKAAIAQDEKLLSYDSCQVSGFTNTVSRDGSHSNMIP